MANDLVSRYRRWFDYERDAHAKVVRSLESVPPARRDCPEYRRAVTLLAHVAAARQLWLCRLGEHHKMPASFFPEDVDLSSLVAELRVIEERWIDYLGKLTDRDLDRTFEYQSLDAGRFRNTIADILTQLFGHSWYHRGQIAILVRAAGGEPAVTDLVYWCREPVPVSS